MTLQGKVAIVTGAARNIGREYSLCLARKGARVVVADIIDGGETVELIKAAGGDAIAVQVDIAQEESVAALASAASDHFGRIDVLVNNAALYGDLEHGSFETLPIEVWDRTMTVNVRGCFLAIRSVIPAMREAGGGSIINISSASIFGMGGVPHYIASKSAIVGLTRCAARDFGPDKIRVNAVAPGFTMSQASKDQLQKFGSNAMADAVRAATALGRLEEPEDLVGTIAFLASDEAAFITGQTIVVDGGWIMQ